MSTAGGFLNTPTQCKLDTVVNSCQSLVPPLPVSPATSLTLLSGWLEMMANRSVREVGLYHSDDSALPWATMGCGPTQVVQAFPVLGQSLLCISCTIQTKITIEHVEIL